MTAPPELSIIVVNWNTRDLTLACLRSLFDQTRETAFEVLLVDNGSHDGSAAAIAAAFPQVRLFAETRNHGFAAANNLAADHAKGRYMLLLNSDTEVLDGAVDRLMAFARATPQARIWGGRTVFADGRLNPQSAWGRVTLWSTLCFALGLTKAFPDSPLFNPEGLGGWNRGSERAVDIVSGCFFLIEAGLWRDLGGFDPLFFMYGEEADLCARARRQGAAPRVTPDATIIHHGGASTTAIDMASYVSGAKVELARRTMNPLAASLTRGLLIGAVAVRASAYGLLARLRPASRATADQWAKVWARRGQWRNGPIQP